MSHQQLAADLALVRKSLAAIRMALRTSTVSHSQNGIALAEHDLAAIEARLTMTGAEA
jgi:ribosomal protein L29